MPKINVKDTEINVCKVNEEDYFCLTDMIKAKDGDFFISDWLRNRNTLEYIGIWEKVYNPNFNYGEFALIKSQSAKRELAKINYHIHTDAIKQNLIPAEVTPAQKSFIYADEADMLNVALFGMTAREWQKVNPGLKGNIRDYATINQLICLSNMENLNAVFISDKLPQGERLEKLNKIAIQQMKVLENIDDRKLLVE
jgi:hypothetical protein